MELYLYQDMYDLEDQHWWHKAKRALIIESLQKLSYSKKSKLLDIGCGTGRNIQAFNNLMEAHGIDMSFAAIKFCKQRGLTTVTKSSAAKTSFKEHSFSVITALDIIEHTDDQAVLKECWRLLKPGGTLIVTVPAYQWAWSKWDEVLHHQRRYTSQSLKAVLTQQGFKLKKLSYVYSFLLLPVLIIRKIKSLNSKDKYSSDFALSNQLIDTILGKVAAVERWLLWRVSIPFGTTVFAIALKPKE